MGPVSESGSTCYIHDHLSWLWLVFFLWGLKDNPFGNPDGSVKGPFEKARAVDISVRELSQTDQVLDGQLDRFSIRTALPRNGRCDLARRQFRAGIKYGVTYQSLYFFDNELAWDKICIYILFPRGKHLRTEKVHLVSSL